MDDERGERLRADANGSSSRGSRQPGARTSSLASIGERTATNPISLMDIQTLSPSGRHAAIRVEPPYGLTPRRIYDLSLFQQSGMSHSRRRTDD